jgi:hypothetical protein
MTGAHDRVKEDKGNRVLKADKCLRKQEAAAGEAAGRGM